MRYCYVITQTKYNTIIMSIIIISYNVGKLKIEGVKVFFLYPSVAAISAALHSQSSRQLRRRLAFVSDEILCDGKN